MNEATMKKRFPLFIQKIFFSRWYSHGSPIFCIYHPVKGGKLMTCAFIHPQVTRSRAARKKSLPIREMRHL
jgi:hypothetical protein